MSSLTMYRGLPACGKTSAAEVECAQNPNAVRINKDDIRATRSRMYPDEPWSQTVEIETCMERDSLIKQALAAGHDVISDDTNFNPQHEATLRRLADHYGAAFSIRMFDVPLDECIRRDAARLKPVGARVIRDMHAKYLAQPMMEPPPLVMRHDVALPWAVICDLDGTLALPGSRRDPLDHTTCDEDDCNHTIRALLDVHRRFLDDRIIYLTGREERFEPQTSAFLRRHNCPQGVTIMRRNGDRRRNEVVKAELFEKHIRGHYNVRFALDDHPDVCRMLRARGVQAFQVADGTPEKRKR